MGMVQEKIRFLPGPLLPSETVGEALRTIAQHLQIAQADSRKPICQRMQIIPPRQKPLNYDWGILISIAQNIVQELVNQSS